MDFCPLCALDNNMSELESGNNQIFYSHNLALELLLASEFLPLTFFANTFMMDLAKMSSSSHNLRPDFVTW